MATRARGTWWPTQQVHPTPHGLFSRERQSRHVTRCREGALGGRQGSEPAGGPAVGYPVKAAVRRPGEQLQARRRAVSTPSARQSEGSRGARSLLFWRSPLDTRTGMKTEPNQPSRSAHRSRTGAEGTVRRGPCGAAVPGADPGAPGRKPGLAAWTPQTDTQPATPCPWHEPLSLTMRTSPFHRWRN